MPSTIVVSSSSLFFPISHANSCKISYQKVDCFFEKTTLELDKLEFLHLRKTGALIAASLELGAVIAGLDDEKAKELYKIGLKIGLAFQIQDDLIDATATSEEAGKPVNHDEFKNSFVNLIGVERSKAYKEKIIAEISENLQNYDENLVNLISNLSLVFWVLFF